MKNRKRTKSDNPNRRLRIWPAEGDCRAFGEELIKKIKYTGSPHHKRNPGDFNLTPSAAPRPGATLCDDAKLFSKNEAMLLLHKGASLGLVDSREKNDLPMLIWSVQEDDQEGSYTVFEARLENAEQGHYHGYPLAAGDKFRNTVLEAYQEMLP